MLSKVLLSPIKKTIEYNQIIGAIKGRKTPVVIHGLSESQKPHIAFGIFEELDGQVCIITYNELEARQIYEDLKFYMGERILFFPTKEVVFYQIEATGEAIQAERAKTLEKLAEGGNYIVITSIDALLLKLTKPQYYIYHHITFRVGETIELQQMLNTLLIQGFERVDRVERSGEFSIRGGIIDIFPASEEAPYRIELFDDEVDSIRRFQVDTQISINKLEEIKIYPTIETIIEPEDNKFINEKLSKELKKTLEKLDEDPGKRLKEKFDEILEKLNELADTKTAQLLLPYLEGREASLLEYLDRNATLILDEPRRLREKGEGVLKEFNDNFETLLERGEVLPSQCKLQFSYDEILGKMVRHPVVTLNLLPKYNPDFQPKEIINFASRSVQTFNGKMDFMVEELKLLQYKGYKVVLLPGTKERALRLLELLNERGLNVSFVVTPQEDLMSGQVIIMQGSVHRGFEYVGAKYMLITDNEIYGVHKRKKQITKRKDAAPIKSFIDLKVGDYVVHEGHGIGKYVGIQQLRVDGLKKDYLKIRYSGEDNLYVPTDQMDLIQKYVGSEDHPPKVNKLGGSEWIKTKAKVKKAIEDMAQDLLKLYAERQKSRGHIFSADTEWQKQFEDLFPYEETPDQLKCIEEVKLDMENHLPMDRLLCGDVGYGKTEVAIRAAFKAVMDGKQVALLVPTTILAQQHYNTFAQRFSGFPVKIDMLSRFKTPQQQKNILENVRTGNVDVIIGTHRILSKDIQFKDLGILIIDEEQRFGVKHKEALKHLKKNIDVLTLTATPIPRTLHMAMIGIRDMSVIEDPPEERFPVQTYVMAHNESIIADAITREIARGGQVYYVYNRVKGIHQMAARLTNLIPHARIGVGHGQMSERQLENLMLEYYEGEYDVLVCTTIIETGLDIPNVNTIIIHDADRLGLSQLYQLRGRVGRSNRQAYAYLMYEKDKVLSEVAEKRLKAIKEFTEFGSGFKIAMRDLEIRGAGNLLGGEQHGHMSAIGYDLYVKLLEEAIGELKGESVERFEETTIELSIDAYISDKYIINQSQKIEIYKKIASIRNKEDLYSVEEEIEDRFGDIPNSVRNLLLISYIKAMAKNLRITSITQKSKEITISFKDSIMLMPENIGEALHTYNRRLSFHGTKVPYFVYKVIETDQNKILSELKDIIEKISGLQKTAN
ncbi:transcription-repair coupling factor [Alkaliphilus peptidifermentans]|uniref:Transcription-repair-coupling factor n=1 Tax=Alkaliphilus peptidifermentans DSM 18978 TaxID=1120976 RepID=A0A1G5ALB2_9FIRM|nr:transcription-repair coupling factor [Alkaliphilus peptidifermentans]SCX78600.1 transcription-repair coupling factor [Alkaliphilus peptidifermentans DSM 18978]